MSAVDLSYNSIVNQVLNTGFWYEDPKRDGVKRLQISRTTFTHDLTHSFPAVATKKLAWKSVCSELMWFLKGHQNIAYLHEHNNHIWDKDAYAHYIRRLKAAHASPNVATMERFLALVEKNTGSKVIPGYSYGDLGPIYGYLWRNWPNNDGSVFDQILNIIGSMRNTPMSTEHIVTAWHPSLKQYQALPPCHFEFQCMMQPLDFGQRDSLLKKQGTLTPAKVFDHKDLDAYGVPKYGFELIWDQRSVDVFLGLPFNIASYALLAHILGKITNSVPLRVTGDLRNVHLYDNSIAAVQEQLTRDPDAHGPAKLLMKDEFHYMCDNNTFTPETILDDLLRPDMFKLYNYKPDGPLKVEMLSRNT